MSKKGETLINVLNNLEITPEIICRWLGDYNNFEKPKWPLNKKGLEDLACAMQDDYMDYGEDEPRPTTTFTLEQAQEFGKIKFVESGGVYHDGGPIWMVFYFEKFGVHLAAEATYSSWDSEHFSETWTEVKEKEVTLTQWVDTQGQALA